jgi:hypothetical protein
LRENKDENYDFSLSKLGRDIKTSIERFMFPERFTLSPSVITNKTLLENDKYYSIGTIKPESQVKTTNASINGGKTCLQFPNIVYKELGNCPTDKTRDTNGVCQWNPCPTNQTRDAAGICQCIQQPYYETYVSSDVPGNDIRCIDKPSNFEGCKLECNKDPNCKAYNLIYKDGSWGAGWGCCLKNTTSIPSPGANKIDYFKKVEGTLVKDSNGVCRAPCPTNQTRDASGVCRWNPCPTNQTRDTAGNCQWNPCPTNQTRDAAGNCQWNPCTIPGQIRDGAGNCNCTSNQTVQSGRCQNKCDIPGQIRDGAGNCNCAIPDQTVQSGRCQNKCDINKTRDGAGNCQWNPCPAGGNSTLNTTTGDCTCNSEFTKAPGKTGRTDTCYPICGRNFTMDSNGNCNCNPPYIQYGYGGPCSIDCGQGYNDTNGNCVCYPGYTRGPNGACISTGQEASLYDIMYFNNLLFQSGMG